MKYSCLKCGFSGEGTIPLPDCPNCNVPVLGEVDPIRIEFSNKTAKDYESKEGFHTNSSNFGHNRSNAVMKAFRTILPIRRKSVYNHTM
jgi:predicted RNA-binding Zn-ribbon protein involved in translation (DUF1610 family)